MQSAKMEPFKLLSFIVAIIFPISVTGQVFVPEYCDWPHFPSIPCKRIQFSPVDASSYELQWQLWSALSSPSNYNAPFVSANYFRYVTTNGATDIGLTARAQSDNMLTVTAPTNATTVICLRFYYYISASTNQLAIYLVENTASGTVTSLLWNIPTTNAVVGSFTRVNLTATLVSWSDSFRLQIEATSTGLQSADTALARLSVTFGQSCFDIIEEDIISTSYTSAPYWGSSTATSPINIYYTFDSTFNTTYQSVISNLMTNSISGLVTTAFLSGASCSLSFTQFYSNQTTPSLPYIKFIREFSVNSVLCAAMIGPYLGVPTEAHLTDSCFTATNSVSLLLHVIAHALGLKHIHRRSDRLNVLILNSYAYDPIYQPYFDADATMSINDTIYDLSSVTQVSPNFLDQTGGRSPYGVFTSIDGFTFGYALFFSHYDILRLANLLGGPSSICSVQRIARCSALCFNGGICSRRPNNDYGACLCRAGFTAPSCNMMSCFPPCQNGFCDPGNICNCASVSNLWTGYRCHIPVNVVCSSLNCSNGGTCIIANGQPTCICQPGYTGLTCSTIICEQCTSSGCPNSTVCVAPNRVNCTTGSRGPLCQTCAAGYIGNSLTGCQPFCSDNCFRHGSCTAPETCTCNIGWTGKKCEACISGYEYLCYATTTLTPTCYPPCSTYGGYCSPLGYCSCYNGYEGRTCDRLSISTTTPLITKTTTAITTPYSPTTTPLIPCIPVRLTYLDSTQLYARYVLSPYEINYQVLTVNNNNQISLERQSLEDFLNRALREELNRFTDVRFRRLAVVNVCPGVVVDVVISYFGALNTTTASRILIQQARAIGVPLTDGKTALSRLDFDYIIQSQFAAVSVDLCTYYNDVGACQNGAVCFPISNGTYHTATLSPLMTPANYTWPICQCPEGYYGEFCQNADLPMPIWATVAIAVGGVLIIVFSAVTVHMICGTGRRRRHRQHRYHRSHPIPPPPRPMPGYLMVPYLQPQPGTLPHPGGAPYNIPIPLPSVNQPPPPISSALPCNNVIDEPPPPYHHISFPGRYSGMQPPGPITGTFPRSQIRADDVDVGDDFSNLPPPPGYAPPSSQPQFMPPPRLQQRTSTADTRNRQMMKRPKLGR